MNKMLKGLLVTVLAVGAAHAHSDHTNKTFLLPRAQGVNLPMEMTTYAELIGMPKEDRFGGNFQVTGFYQQSTDKSDIAEYFLINHKNTITLKKNAAAAATISTVNDDLDLGYLIHHFDGAAINPSATVTLDPQQTAYGARFDYYQNMDKLLKGLYLKVDLPVVHVENDPKLGVNSTDATVKANLANYLKGDYDLLTAASQNRQAKLTNAKIAGKQSETGVADIDVALGYLFLNKEKYHAGLAIAITIPTGNEADGIYMFEPIVGNGKHFGLGGDFCAGFRAWGDVDHNIKLALKLKYRYLFENSEHRTLGIKDRQWGQYHLLANGPVPNANDALLTPAANLTTLNVDVTPGSQFDGILDFAYNNGGFNFDLGYDMYFREAESVKLKGSIVASKYAVAARNLNTAVNGHDGLLTAETFAAANNAVDGAAAAGTPNILTNDRLDLASAETPSQFTNSIYGGLSYIFKEWDTPLMLGIGGKYEWPSKNSALEQWGLWGKLGIAF